MSQARPTVKVKRLESAEDENSLRELATQAFNFPDDHWASYPPIVGRENLRIATVSDQVVGGMSYYPVGQWFGGRVVPMAAFALVLTAPELRGCGYGFVMCASVMSDVRRKFPIATLYATTQQFYRKLGFEQAGNAYQYACPIQDIGRARMKLPMRRVDPETNLDLLQSLAHQRAARTNGCLERNAGMWKRIYRELAGKVFCYIVGEPGREVGYLVYDQPRYLGRTTLVEHQSEQQAFSIRDVVALNADALETVWAFVAGNQSTSHVVQWTGPATDARNLFMAEFNTRVVRPHRWMLRVLDVRQALLKRGYNRINADVSFEITDDPLFPENNGKFTLRLRNGAPEIVDGEPAGAAVKVTVRDFAPLYSGLWTAEQLHAVGRLQCADLELLALATQAFSSGEPWMPDMF